MLPRLRAQQLRHLAQSLRHHQLAPRAAVALIQAEGRLRVRHLRRLHLRLRLTPRHLPPAEVVVVAADRTEAFFISEIFERKTAPQFGAVFLY